MFHPLEYFVGNYSVNKFVYPLYIRTRKKIGRDLAGRDAPKQRSIATFQLERFSLRLRPRSGEERKKKPSSFTLSSFPAPQIKISHQSTAGRTGGRGVGVGVRRRRWRRRAGVQRIAVVAASDKKDGKSLRGGSTRHRIDIVAGDGEGTLAGGVEGEWFWIRRRLDQAAMAAYDAECSCRPETPLSNQLLSPYTLYHPFSNS
ncbi:hypothetical protein GWI33_014449 [Rhynchophorus ferrugineus]|uniref:Uncharacterized protein n=1 Tax=Rhynchophorus ferrugineus TaxID=354439 RepID=A0A834IF40_RHYFE|nr:hypothetical protein GWI33_014449 [Rhynchophorus ferrugineus]